MWTVSRRALASLRPQSSQSLTAGVGRRVETYWRGEAGDPAGAAVAYELAGKGNEYVGSSVWRLGHPKEAVAEVAAGLDACVKSQPEVYQRFDVDGYPDALGYTETGGDPPSFTRRILIPLSDRVVIVSSNRDGDDDFAVRPDDFAKKAVAASKDAPKA